jgi:hypothetical protein
MSQIVDAVKHYSHLLGLTEPTSYTNNTEILVNEDDFLADLSADVRIEDDCSEDENERTKKIQSLTIRKVVLMRRIAMTTMGCFQPWTKCTVIRGKLIFTSKCDY